MSNKFHGREVDSTEERCLSDMKNIEEGRTLSRKDVRESRSWGQFNVRPRYISEVHALTRP